MEKKLIHHKLAIHHKFVSEYSRNTVIIVVLLELPSRNIFFRTSYLHLVLWILWLSADKAYEMLGTMNYLVLKNHSEFERYLVTANYKMK